jgi:hypothetical protein
MDDDRRLRDTAARPAARKGPARPGTIADAEREVRRRECGAGGRSRGRGGAAGRRAPTSASGATTAVRGSGRGPGSTTTRRALPRSAAASGPAARTAAASTTGPSTGPSGSACRRRVVSGSRRPGGGDRSGRRRPPGRSGRARSSRSHRGLAQARPRGRRSPRPRVVPAASDPESAWRPSRFSPSRSERFGAHHGRAAFVPISVESTLARRDVQGLCLRVDLSSSCLNHVREVFCRCHVGAGASAAGCWPRWRPGRSPADRRSPRGSVGSRRRRRSRGAPSPRRWRTGKVAAPPAASPAPRRRST